MERKSIRVYKSMKDGQRSVRSTKGERKRPSCHNGRYPPSGMGGKWLNISRVQGSHWFTIIPRSGK